MQLNLNCLLCNMKQVLTVSSVAGADEEKTERIMREVMGYLKETDYARSNPEVIQGTWEIITKHLKDADPYREIRSSYNEELLGLSPAVRSMIQEADDSFDAALKLAITANLIDFAASHSFDREMVMEKLHCAREQELAVDESSKLKQALAGAQSLLYLGDNCGEIVIDKLFLEELRREFPQLTMYFGVRGAPIVNDVTFDDAMQVGMSEVARVISNGDGSLGTVLHRTSPDFQQVFKEADVIIAKGQGNYESLSETAHKNLFFLFMAKCEVVARAAGVKNMSIVCQKAKA